MCIPTSLSPEEEDMRRFCPTQIDLAALGHVPLYRGTGQSNPTP
jgi:hypothetical protein